MVNPIGHENLSSRLRFIEQDGKRILQQAVMSKQQANGKTFWQIERWQDVPFVEATDSA